MRAASPELHERLDSRWDADWGREWHAGRGRGNACSMLEMDYALVGARADTVLII